MVGDMSFEDAFARLEETVHTLERGELTLAEMVAVYEEGIKLCERCTRLLDAAELRVSQLAESVDESEAGSFRLDGAAQTPGSDPD